MRSQNSDISVSNLCAWKDHLSSKALGPSSKLQTCNCSNPRLQQEKTFPRNTTTSPFNAMALLPVRNECNAAPCLRDWQKLHDLPHHRSGHGSFSPTSTILATLLRTLTSSKVAPWRHCSLQRSSPLPRCGRRRTQAAEKKPDESYGNRQHSWAYYYITGILYYIIHTNSVRPFREN